MNTNLRLDVNVLDAKNIIKWLRNKDVTKQADYYLII